MGTVGMGLVDCLQAITTNLEGCVVNGVGKEVNEIWGRLLMVIEFVNYKYGREINQEFSLERWECLNRLNE